jgi:hypothetical protein
MQNLQAAVVQVGIDLKLFRYLVESDAPLTVQQLSEKTGSEPELLSKWRCPELSKTEPNYVDSPRAEVPCFHRFNKGRRQSTIQCQSCNPKSCGAISRSWSVALVSAGVECNVMFLC